jgi:hypothetical protein
MCYLHRKVRLIPKRRCNSTRPHGITSQKLVIFIITTVGTWHISSHCLLLQSTAVSVVKYKIHHKTKNDGYMGLVNW